MADESDETLANFLNRHGFTKTNAMRIEQVTDVVLAKQLVGLHFVDFCELIAVSMVSNNGITYDEVKKFADIVDDTKAAQKSETTTLIQTLGDNLQTVRENLQDEHNKNNALTQKIEDFLESNNYLQNKIMKLTAKTQRQQFNFEELQKEIYQLKARNDALIEDKKNLQQQLAEETRVKQREEIANLSAWQDHDVHRVDVTARWQKGILQRLRAL